MTPVSAFTMPLYEREILGPLFCGSTLCRNTDSPPITALPVDIRPTTLKGQERKPG